MKSELTADIFKCRESIQTTPPHSHLPKNGISGFFGKIGSPGNMIPHSRAATPSGGASAARGSDSAAGLDHVVQISCPRPRRCFWSLRNVFGFWPLSRHLASCVSRSCFWEFVPHTLPPWGFSRDPAPRPGSGLMVTATSAGQGTVPRDVTSY